MGASQAGAAHRDHVVEVARRCRPPCRRRRRSARGRAASGSVTRSITMWTASPIGIGGPSPITSARVERRDLGGERSARALAARGDLDLALARRPCRLSCSRAVDPGVALGDAAVDLGFGRLGSARSASTAGAVELVESRSVDELVVVGQAWTSVPSRPLASRDPDDAGDRAGARGRGWRRRTAAAAARPRCTASPAPTPRRSRGS